MPNGRMLTSRTDLYQHRLDLPSSSASTASTEALEPSSGPLPSFTTLHLPLSSFVLTNSGHTAERQMEMLSSRVRTIGFSLLGGGRGEEGMPIVNNQPSPAAIAEMRRRAQAGFGAGGGSESPDPIVEQMLAQDGIVLNKSQSISPAARARASGYHRVNEDAPSSGLGMIEDDPEQADATLLRPREEVAVKVTPFSEGYYELCVRSIQAVNFAEDEGAESADM
jgi:NADH dehydrogenase [ubiquinone] 1 alpha subcomplex assembly factor 1